MEELKVEVKMSELVLEDKENPEYEVDKVLDHKCDNGQYYFLLKFKGFPETEWVHDKDCFCEKLIREYLNRKDPNLRTVYCVCRVSTKKQAGPTHVSLQVQEERLKRISAPYEGYRIKFLHISESAYKNIPNMLLRVGEVANKGDKILIYRVDRLSRNIVKFLAFLENLNDRGVEIFSQEEGIWYSSKKLEFIQRIVDANREAELLGKRIKDAFALRKARGDECLGRPPFGFRLIRSDNNRLVKVENMAEKKIICMIKDLYLNSDYNSAQDIANILNEGKFFKRGKQWSAEMVRQYW